jgi:protoporphyrinogen/coproporphyrinogen III oxidase
MMGGHRFASVLGPDPSKIDESDVLDRAKRTVRDHLGIKDAPVASKVSIHVDALAQYRVGHSEVLRRVHEGLMKEGKGRISVCGSSYLGVGVNDAVRSARDVAMAVLKGDPVSGLERVLEE